MINKTTNSANARASAHGVSAALITSNLAAMTTPAAMKTGARGDTKIDPKLLNIYNQFEAEDSFPWI